VFGRENQVAGSIILNNVERFDELTDAVTDTNVAFEQAATASQTLEFQSNKTNAVYESLILSLDDGNGVLSQTAIQYEGLKQNLFEFLLVANDAEATTEDLTDSLSELGKSAEDFGLASGFTGAITNAEELRSQIDGVIDASVRRRSAEAETSNDLEALLTSEIAKREELAKAAEDTNAPFLKQVAEEKLKTQGDIVSALQAEIDKRRELEQVQVSALLSAGITGLAPTIDPAAAKAQSDQDKKDADKRREEREKLERQLAELRIKVLKEGEEEELALLELKFQDELKKFKGNEEAKKLLTEQFAQESQDIRQQFAEREIESRQEALKQIEANRREAFDLEQAAIERTAEEQKLLNSQTLTDAEELADQEVEIEIAKLEAIIALRKAAGEDTLSQEQELANLRLGIRQEEIAAEEALIEQRKQAARELANTLVSFLQEGIKRREEAEIQAIRNKSDEETAAIDKRLENETLSEQQRESLLEKRAEIEKEADEESKKIQREAAERQKQFALIEAAINNSVAITKALTTGNPLLAAIVAAKGFAELIAIGSAPIPQFAKGTNNSPEGVALVGEQGPELVYLRKGSTVKTAEQTKSILSDTASGAQLSKMLDEQVRIEYEVRHNHNYISNDNSSAAGIGDLAFTQDGKRNRKLYRDIDDKLRQLVELQKKGNSKYH